MAYEIFIPINFHNELVDDTSLSWVYMKNQRIAKFMQQWEK